MSWVSKLDAPTNYCETDVRQAPLLVFLLCILISTRVSAADDGVAYAQGASSAPLSATVQAVASETTTEGPAAEPGSTAAGSFDFSYFLVLCLGLGGLFWVRRQSQTL
jgi:hypothetical protein